MTTGSADLPTGRWSEELAADFMAGLDPVARRMTRHVWGAGESGIHRRALCQRTESTPAELRSLLVRMSHALRRFQRERGITLARPVVSNSPLQSYFVDPDFAAVGASHPGRRGDGGPAGLRRVAPWMDARYRAFGRTNRAAAVAHADDDCRPVDPCLACGVDADDSAVVRRYAGCLADTNTALHRLNASGAVGTVPLSAEAVEERVRDQLERGELTMAKIRANYARHCE